MGLLPFEKGGLALIALLLGACGGKDTRLTLFAAASTREVVEPLLDAFSAHEVRTSFGSSGALARQIEDGAPADVFLSANRAWVEHLDAAQVLAGEARTVCRNRLVCVTASGSHLAAAGPASPAALVGALASGDRVAIADAGAPAGEYARQSLSATGDLDRLGPSLVGLSDVRAVLRSVLAREAVAGFVYSSDTRLAPVVVLFELDPATHQPVEYVAAVVAHTAHPADARALLEHLTSDETHAALAAAGFEVER